ncbi:amino acid adenylation domain-containing protein [Actinoplanes sp. TBRC 11911]|uniref:amino acid adenylation domain-containing protein n=1 Tax=Actinoplanes sp. TBRC 11911 TaxID=2729386 RepID=UPI00145C6042|nr:amino acid adenylation domain-containing protein [Actinoplanes sp. TBRC 11911]NMO50545.1 amino acid adenylation domain-containing protein [Actinoplanes sp. TBRC 11911]
MTIIGRRVPLPDDTVVHRSFERHARSNPGQIAVTCGDESLTYAELNARANRLAHRLAARGVGPGVIVGVCIDRNLHLMEAILAILKTGAAYVPLDPTYPRDRLEVMVSQLDALSLILSAASTVELVASLPAEIVDLSTPAAEYHPDTDPVLELTGDDICYAVFTSGSTGVPKAVAVRHEGWFNLLTWLRIEYELDTSSSDLMISSFGFDITQRSLMAPLFCGATLHLLPSRSFDISMAYRIIGDRRVRTLHCAPSTLYLLIEREVATGGAALHALRYVFIGGEPMNARRVADWAARAGNACLLLHQYGVAECTDVASSHPMVDFPAYASGALPVGQPVYNTEIHLLDEGLKEVPDGETGEICISGISVGAGYLNAVPADHLRFLTTDIGGRPTRIYRTGDRGYVGPTGELVVVGRADAQVKVRGMRIDLGDIEHAVRRHPRVSDVAVLPVHAMDGQVELAAFVIPQDEALRFPALRRDLLGVLPRNMVPQRFIPMDEFPLSPNGKIDRRRLADLVPAAGAQS